MTDVTMRSGGVWDPDRRRLTTGLVVTITLVAFESLSVATVLPVISRQLGGIRLYGWVFSAFFLASLVGIAAAGVLADRRGLALPLAGGLVLFAAGLVVGGTAPSMAVLVGGRALQGFGAGAVPAAAYTAIGRGYAPTAQPKMFAVLSTAWVVPGLMGPSLAALVASGPGWRWVFLGLVPVVAVASVLCVPAISAVARPGGTAELAGTILAPDAESAPDTESAPDAEVAPDAEAEAAHMGVGTAGLVAVAAAVVLAGLSARSLPVILALVGAGLLAGGPALRRLLPAGSLIARRGLPAAIGTRGLLTFGFFAADAYVPLALTSIRHTSTAYGGLTLTVSTMMWTVGAWAQARLMATQGPRRLVTVGLGMVAGGTLLMAATLSDRVPLWVAPMGWGLAGLGIGTAYSPISVTALDRAEPGAEGRASASVQFSDVLGTALGTGVAGAAVAFGHRSGWDPRIGLAVAFAIAGCVSALGLAGARRIPRRLSSA